MDSGTVRFLAEYNEIVNRKMDLHIAGLDEEAWARKFGGYFNSIRALCNHLYIADFNWLKRFSNLREFNYIRDEFFRKDIKFGTHAVSSIPEYLEMRKAMDKRISAFSGEVRDDDIGKTLIYNDSHGDEHRQNFGLVTLHVFNHQTHHRGMISLYLEELGVANDYSDIMDII